MLVNCHLLREEPYGKVKGGFILYFFFPNERYGGNYYSFHLYSLKIKSNSRGRKWAPKIRTESQEKQLGSIRDFFGFLKYSPARPSKRVISSLTPVSDSSTNSSWKWPTWEWCLCLWGTHLGNCLLCFSFLLALTLLAPFDIEGERLALQCMKCQLGSNQCTAIDFILCLKELGFFGGGSKEGRRVLYPQLLHCPLLGVVWMQPVNPALQQLHFIKLRPVQWLAMLKSCQDLLMDSNSWSIRGQSRAIPSKATLNGRTWTW